jgi:TrmH family RNA methyltransferase
MGSIARIEVIYEELEAYMQNHPQSYYGATLDGKPLDKIGRLKAGVIVIGNESKGIRPGVFERLTDKITINRIGQAESLNAAGGYGGDSIASRVVGLMGCSGIMGLDGILIIIH